MTEAKGPQIFKKFWEPNENSGPQKGDMQHVPYSGSINIRQRIVGRHSAVGIVICYGIDGPGSNPARGKVFRINPGRLVIVTGFLFWGKSGRDMVLTTHPI